MILSSCDKGNMIQNLLIYLHVGFKNGVFE